MTNQGGRGGAKPAGKAGGKAGGPGKFSGPGKAGGGKPGAGKAGGKPGGAAKAGGKPRGPKVFSHARPRPEGGKVAGKGARSTAIAFVQEDPTEVAGPAVPSVGVTRAMLPRGFVRVLLAKGKSKPFWIGHPWIFSGAIAKVEGAGGPVGVEGAPCIVEDERGNALGTGFYSPEAQIAVRLHWHRRTTDLPFEPPEFLGLIRERIAAAVRLRAQLGFPNERTNVYRVVNAEGDYLPGLIVDRLGSAVSVQLGSRPMLDARNVIAAALREAFKPSRIAFTVTETASRLEGIPVTHELEPESGEDEIEVREDGLRYRIDLGSMQKTGFYCDQRENRIRFAALCAGKSVLDAYCHFGGFGLQAARAGATKVVQVDTSNPVIAAARAAAELNGLEGKIEALNDDAINYLKESQALGRSWERIVVDPPKLAQGRGHLEDALQKYARLNTLAMATLAPGGLLLTNSCSRHVGEEEFGRMLTEAGHRLRKGVRVLERWGQPADHPTLTVAPEGRYLKSWLVALD